MPAPDPIEKEAKPVDLPRFLLQLLDGNIHSAEQLERLAKTFLKLSRNMMVVSIVMLAALSFFLLGQVCFLIAELIHAGVIR